MVKEGLLEDTKRSLIAIIEKTHIGVVKEE